MDAESLDETEKDVVVDVGVAEVVGIQVPQSLHVVEEIRELSSREDHLARLALVIEEVEELGIVTFVPSGLARFSDSGINCVGSIVLGFLVSIYGLHGVKMFYLVGMNALKILLIAEKEEVLFLITMKVPFFSACLHLHSDPTIGVAASDAWNCHLELLSLGLCP
ncbi:hypothetical protein U1Q18_020349 [Sarracenia purpurea var. burkii]